MDGGNVSDSEESAAREALAAALYRSEYGAVRWKNLPQYARDGYLRRADDLLAVVRPVIEAEERAGVAATLRYVADGRADYLRTYPEGHERSSIEHDVRVLRSAAEIADGSDAPLYGLLPAWRWTPRMLDTQKRRPSSDRTPCPEGFHWIGQPWTNCDKCSLPAWEHDGMATPAQDSSFCDEWTLQPWKPGQVGYRAPTE